MIPEEAISVQPVAPRSNPTTSLLSLPNEILYTILTPFSTPSLLPYVRLSHRFAHLILRIYYHRLLISTQLTGDRSVQLECYRPLDRLSAETLLCWPLGTESLEPPDPNIGVPEQLRRYNASFTRFRPYRRGTMKIRPRRHPAGDVPGTRTHQIAEMYAQSDAGSSSTLVADEASTTSSSASTVVDVSTAGSSKAATLEAAQVVEVEQKLPPLKQAINLDAHEMFTQLQTTTTLVTAGPRRGLLSNAVAASEGVVRIWRKWLHDQDQRRKKREKLNLKEPDEEQFPIQDESIRWVNDAHENVGVRFTVSERKWRRENPILIRADEDVAIHYELQIEEVMVRTRRLLVVTEQSIREQQNARGSRAVVISSNW